MYVQQVSLDATLSTMHASATIAFGVVTTLTFDI